MNNKNIVKIRTVSMNERGQIVIPQEMRNDMKIDKTSILVLIEKNNELIIRKETDVLKSLDDEEVFWKKMTKRSIERAWDKEDDIWDKLYKEGKI